MKLTKFVSPLLVLLSSGAALAGGAPTTTITPTVSAPGAFTSSFQFTTTQNYNPQSGILYVSGLDSTVSSLNLDIKTLGGVDLTGVIGGVDSSNLLKASFSDKNFGFNLAAGTTYEAIVSGATKGSGASLTLSGTYINSIIPVPEPDSYGMLLAGLGLMAAVAGRRRKG